jgi:ketosteroid isomerase-like protein
MIAFKKAVPVLSLVFALGAGDAVTSWAANSPDVAALHAADDAWLRAYSSGQVENVVALYDENALVFPPGAAPLNGRAAIRAYFEKDMAGFAQSGLEMSLDKTPTGGASGNLGWASGTWTLKDKSGQVVDSGWYFSVSRKVAGKWLYVRDAWDSNQPAAPTAPVEN